jgi:glycosyltransferase EpsD
MKKVLIVANVAKEHINKFHIPTIKEMKRRGWTVDVACSGDEKVPFCDTQIKAEWKRSPFTPKTIKGIFQLKKIIKDGKYDLIYCHTPVGGLVARLAAKKEKKSGTRVVYFAHGLHFFKGAPILNWLIYYPIEKILSYFTDMIITINNEDYENVKKRFNKKLKVNIVPGVGVDFSRLNIENKEEVRKEYRENLNIPQNSTVLIYIAELKKNKNQKMLIEALKKLREKEDAYLLLVGPDHINGEYERLASELQVKEYVKSLGWRSDVGQLLHSADICVASSIREGFGINLVEAMYCSLPVVASKNRGHITIIEDGVNGFLVETGDYITMAEKVKEIINDEKIKEKFSHVDVEEYEREKIAHHLVNELEEICKQHQGEEK